MRKILLYLFSFTSVGKYLDGKKTVVGAAMILVSAIVSALAQVAPLFPEVVWLTQVAAASADFLAQANELLRELGLGLITVGLAHKAAKAGK